MTYQMNKELLKKLSCPKCEGPLQPQDESLLCLKCKLIYPVVDGIIVLLEEKAKSSD